MSSAAELFVRKLGKALHAYGSPAHRLEEALEHLARHFDVRVQFFSTPTAIFAAFGEDDDQRTFLTRVEPGDVHLEKLSALDQVVGRVLEGELGPEEAIRWTEEIVAAPPRYGASVTTLAFALVSAAAARFFGGGWREIVAALGAGLLVGLWALLAGRFRHMGRLFEPVGGLLVAFAATVAGVAAAPLVPYVVTLSALIVLVPGMTLTVAMTELATRHLMSGSGRLAGAVLVFLTLGFGVALGGRLGVLLVGESPAVEPHALPGWTEVPAVALSALAFTVLFRARPRDAGWIMIAGAVAISGARAGGALLGPQLGALLAALLVGVAGNVFARLAERPSAVMQLPGLILLVPGSLGFRGVASMVADDVLTGVQAGFHMALVAIALVTGILMANVLVPPRRAL